MRDDLTIQLPFGAIPVPGWPEYMVTPWGDVWSTKWTGGRLLSTWMSKAGPRVCLWRNGKRWQPLVKTLTKRAFSEPDAEPEPLSEDELSDIEADYGDHPDVVAWLKRCA